MKQINLKVNIAGIEFKNPVMGASGTFANGREFAEYMDIESLGAIVTKGVSPIPWEGNETPRICETNAGMMNAIGLQNPGVDAFIKNDLEYLEKLNTNIIVNVCGHSEEEYTEVVKKLNDTGVDAFEINVSCPNVKEGGIAFGTNPKKLESITKKIKKVSKKPVIIKLSPNVTDIKEMADAAESGGADVISLINTLIGMKIDIERKDFAIKNKTGGLSGPAIHPIAVRMVYEAAKKVKIPVIGMGGIIDYEGAVEMMMAGAKAVMVGTANFTNPAVMKDIILGIESYLERHDILDINDIVGIV